jgi:hypothetical protein
MQTTLKATWRLEALPVPEVRWVSIRGAIGLIGPIVLSALLAGFTMSTGLLLSACLVTALWLQYSFWKPAHYFGVRICNWMPFTRKRERPRTAGFDSRKAEMEAHRRLVCSGITRSIFAVLWLVLLALLSWANQAIYHRSFEAERGEVYQNFRASPPKSSEESLSSAEITVQDNSPVKMRLLRYGCRALSARTSNGMSFLGTTTGKDLGVVLSGAGDGETLSCVPNRVVKVNPPVYTTCADILWTIDYVLVDQTETPQSKQFRSELQAGHTQWQLKSVNAPVLNCLNGGGQTGR